MRRFLISFFIIGATGFVIPYTSSVFVKLIPFTLIFNFGLLMLYHRSGFDLKFILVSVFIFLSGIALEIAGVQTGLVFGTYSYGSGLGIKIYGTPILIGMNWLFLVYVTSAFIQKNNVHPIILILVRSSMMVVYDFVVEQVAPRMDMWSWKNSVVPLHNYIAWFAISAVFHTILQIAGVKIKNPLAGFLFLIQLLFFAALYILF